MDRWVDKWMDRCEIGEIEKIYGGKKAITQCGHKPLWAVLFWSLLGFGVLNQSYSTSLVSNAMNLLSQLVSLTAGKGRSCFWKFHNLYCEE